MITIDLQNAVSGLQGFAFGASVALALSGVIFSLCMRWFIFQKADEPGWKALIPFYSDYLCYDIVWDGQIYLVLLFGTIFSILVGCLIALVDPVAGFATACVTAAIITGARMIAHLMLQFRYARAFRRSDAFAIGLYLINPVFMAILAFGECQYVGVTGIQPTSAVAVQYHSGPLHQPPARPQQARSSDDVPW